MASDGLGTVKLDFEAIGTRIREAREAQGISQEELAIKVSKTQKTISKYENGYPGMFVSDLITFADALRVTPTYFLIGQLSPQEIDQVILAELQRLKTADAKTALLRLVQVFCDFTEPLEK